MTKLITGIIEREIQLTLTDKIEQEEDCNLKSVWVFKHNHI